MTREARPFAVRETSTRDPEARLARVRQGLPSAGSSRDRRGRAVHRWLVSSSLVTVTAAAVVLACAAHLAAGATASDFRVSSPRGAVPEAAFVRESYRPGDRAALRVWNGGRGSGSMRVVAVGRGHRTSGDPLAARPVTQWRRVATLRAGRMIRIQIGRWPSGLYCVELRTRAGTTFAPFVVLPRRLRTNPVAVVLPTRTWQAYNRRDGDGDGIGDTWYEEDGIGAVQLGRPFADEGVPPQFASYDLPFLVWLHRTGRAVDVLAQEDLDAATGAELAARYDLLVFPGHHEYVTEQEYDAVSGFRDRGGNLMFLSANNFFWKISVRDGRMTRLQRWRALDRSEAGLVGAQYIGSGHGIRGPWQVRRGAAPRWMFAGVRLGPRGEFSSGGIEVDAVAPSSPPGTRVVAEIPNVLGRGRSAQMTYYKTERGAEVFAAGAFTLAGSLRQPAVRQLLTNVWNRLARSTETSTGIRPVTVAELRRQAPATALRGAASTLQQYPSPHLTTVFERAEALRILLESERAARRWRDPRAAKRDGFDTTRPKRVRGETRVMWFHSESRRNHGDDAYLDPARPDTLIYADAPGRPLSLVGVMFSMPRGVQGSNLGGPITRWHWHAVCTGGVKRGLKPRKDGTCPGGTRLFGGSEMLHVWFTGELRSAYAIHAPVPELCKAKLVSREGCAGNHEHGM